MIRLLSISWYSLRQTRYFYVLAALFIILLASIPFAAQKIVNAIVSGAAEFQQLKMMGIPFFDFVDIWQNLFWIFKFFSIFLGFIIVIAVSSDISQGLMKQQVIDGLSRAEYLWSKLLLIIVLSLVMTGIASLIVLYMGFMYSPVHDLSSILEHVEFIPAYFLHLVAFQSFCLVVTLLIKRSGFAIATLLFYVILIEPLLVHYLWAKGFLAFVEFFPVNAISNIIRFPFYKYAFRETLTTVSMVDLGICLGYLGLFIGSSYLLMTRRDLTS